MRKRTASVLGLAAVSALTLGFAGAPAMADDVSGSPTRAPAPAPAPLAGPTADQIREKIANCDEQLSSGEYATDADGSGTIPVCKTGSAVHWTSDYDIDCDGQETEQCNSSTDPSYQPETAFTQSDGKPLNSAELPFIVVPLKSDLWDYTSAGIGGGTVGVVTYGDKVAYAVVGDLGPKSIIGEGSYELAEQLGIDPDPSTGGVEDGVSFVLFPDVKADPIEDAEQAVTKGEEAANAFVNG